MARKGKMSTIRWKSNKREWLNGRLGDKSKKEIKMIEEGKEKYLQNLEEQNRPPRYRRKQGNEWIEIL